MENLTLKEMVDAKFAEIENMIVEAAKNGAEVKKKSIDCVTIGNLTLYKAGEKGAWTLNQFNDPVVIGLFAPDREALQREADNLRAKLSDIEQQLAERSAQ